MDGMHHSLSMLITGNNVRSINSSFLKNIQLFNLLQEFFKYVYWNTV